MGYDKCILPSIIIMQAEIDTDGLETFIKRMQKYDSLMGETDRMQFLENKIKEYEKVTNNNNNNRNTNGV